jgi:peptidyl-tRNA hydrolase, PTH1 family
MKLIVGLGNPGIQYALTRHNVGFWVIDALSKQWQIPIHREKWQAAMGEGMIEREKVLLIKPLTYMNRSGTAVRSAIDWFKIDLDDLCIIYDDLDLPLGKIRLRPQGSPGGHNGMKSLITCLGNHSFKRIKIGIGRPTELSVSSYVLSPFLAEEKDQIDQAVLQSVRAIQTWIHTDFIQAMNQYNGR